MRSRHADEFNHDRWSEGYDREVLDETNPIRAGYGALLDWTVARAAIGPDDVVLDLGAGTGNTAARIPAAGRVIVVDVSEKMLAQAADKLEHLTAVEVRQADLLEVFDQPLPPIDAIVSTYAIHHLVEDEKAELFRRMHDALAPGGRAVLGDLMFESAAAREAIAAQWTDAERARTLRSLEEEFPFFLDHAVPALEAAGFGAVEVERFSALSWGLAMRR